MATKKVFFKYGTSSIKDGSHIRFWEDSWLGNRPLREQYPALYSIFHWNLHPNGKFSVYSLCNAIIQSDLPVDSNKKIWRMKIPLKTKIFGWYLRRGVILTKDNLIKRNWHGSSQCIFCHHNETIKHLFFQCRFARSIWSIIQIASKLYPSTSVDNIFGNWLHGIDLRFRMFIGWER
jgi:hypothetical protein